jgi:hypothetical protein
MPCWMLIKTRAVVGSRVVGICEPLFRAASAWNVVPSGPGRRMRPAYRVGSEPFSRAAIARQASAEQSAARRRRDSRC